LARAAKKFKLAQNQGRPSTGSLRSAIARLRSETLQKRPTEKSSSVAGAFGPLYATGNDRPFVPGACLAGFQCRGARLVLGRNREWLRMVTPA
jgi:hypothetical protein